VKNQRGPRMASFANAVLRKLATRAERIASAEREEAIVQSTPVWLRAALERALTSEGALAFLRAGSEPPAVALRVESASEREAWLERLRAAAPEATFEAGRVSPRAILARGAGKPQSLPGWDDGAWTVQEEGSQLAALAVGARPGEAVLDACAGRGNKTGVLARAVLPGGGVDACDSQPSKLERLGSELMRLGLFPHATFAVDWMVGSGEVTGEYDRVLVDAPCTGVGTLRRRPEIALRRDSTDLAAKTQQQIAITSRAAEHVRPGGALVYVVCSVLREECEDVMTALLTARPELAAAPFESSEARAVCGDAASFRLLPHEHGTDGYFVAMLRRR